MSSRVDLPSDDEIDKLLGLSGDESFEESETTEETPSEETKAEDTPAKNDELASLREELKDLKSEISEGYKQLQKNSAPEPEPDKIMNELGEISEEELEDLPENVRNRIKHIDVLEKKYAELEKSRQEDEVKNRADGFVRDLEDLAKDNPALKDKNVRYATLMYAANGLGDTSKEGFLRAFKDLSKSFGTSAKADVAKQVQSAKQAKESAPAIGKGGIPSLSTSDAPKTLEQATKMAQEFLSKL